MILACRVEIKADKVLDHSRILTEVKEWLDENVGVDHWCYIGTHVEFGANRIELAKFVFTTEEAGMQFKLAWGGE